MAINSKVLIKILNVLTWAGFIGLCIKAGALLFSYWVSMYRNALGAKNLYMGLDLSQLKEYGNMEYSILVACIFLIIALQAILFYVLIKIFQKINLLSPFHETIGKYFLRLSFLSLAIAVLSKLTVGMCSKYFSEGLTMPHLMEHIGLGDAFLFFAGVLFFIAVLYKRGIELQNENDLTI